MSTLEIVSGKAAGTVVDLADFASKDKITLGNRRTATVVIKDPWVSFMHAVITQDGSEFLISDKRSKAGTFVNGTKIGQTGTRLKSGDEIALGKTKLRFVSAGGGAAPSGGAAAAPAAAAASGPFTPHTAPTAAGPAVTGDAARLQASLDKANADLKTLRAAVGQREKALAEIKARNRELEAGGGDPEVAARLKEAETTSRQAQRALQDTTTKAKIRIEELGRLNQSLEARLAQGGAGNVVEMEREIARLREEGRKLQEDARVRIQELTLKAEAGGAMGDELKAVEAEVAESKAKVAALQDDLESAKASFGHAQSQKMDLEMQVEDLQGAIEKIGKSGEETAAMEAVITDLGTKLKASQDELIQVRASLLAGDAGAAAAKAADDGKLGELEESVATLEGKLKDAESRAQKAEAEAAEAKATAETAQSAADQAEAKAAELAAAPAAAAAAPAAGGGDSAAASGDSAGLEARVEELTAENEGLLKDLEEINEDMLAQEEEYMERIQELEDKLAGN